MKITLDNRTIVPSYIIAAMWYMMCIKFIPEPWCAIFKIVPISLLIVALFSQLKELKTERWTLILPIIALSLSTVGDIFGDMKIGEFSDIAFLLQIFFFLAAHFVYIGTFVRYSLKPRPDGLSKWDAAGRLVAALLLILAVITLCDRVLSVVESPVFRVAISGYMVIISLMALTAIMQTREHVWFTIAGALLFVVSDSIIAWTAFVPDNGIPLAIEDTLVFLTYYGAQLLMNVGLVKKTA